MVQLEQTFQAIKYKRKHALHLHCLYNYDSVMRMKKKNYLQVYLKECKHGMKKRKMTKFIEAELKSESQLDSDIELELKSGLESDTE